MGHDQRFKELLQTFLREFLQLFFPDVEQALDFRKIEFLDNEVFTDLGDGSARRADVVAKLATRDGEPELVLIHCEVQAAPEKDLHARMFEYYALLRARYRLPVYPVAVFLRGGTEGLTTEEYRVHFFGKEIVRFRYQSVALARLDVEEYREGVGPVGAALAALMDTSRTPERAELKASLLLQILESGLDEARQLLLGNLIRTYLELSPDESERYRKLVARKEYRKVQDVEETWMDRVLRQGEEKGLRTGMTRGKQETLLVLLGQKFGEVPESLAARIRSIESDERLDGFLKRVLDATSLDDMGLDGA